MKLIPHPLAAAWPKRSPEQLDALRVSIQTIGQQQPIIRHGKYIIDGNQRLPLIIETGKAPKFADYKGDTSPAGIMQAIAAYNGGRHLETSQRGMLAAEMLPHFAKDKAGAKLHSTDAFAASAKLFAVSRRTVFYCQEIIKADPKLAARVKAGELKVSKARRSLQRSEKRKAWSSLAKSIELNDRTCRILTGDCRKALDAVKDASVDLIATDPPYGIDEDYHGHDDQMNEQQLMELLAGAVTQSVRVLKPTGSLFMMMSSRYAIQTGLLLESAGLYRQSMIIWAESFGTHNPHYFADCYRVIHHYTKSRDTFTFNSTDTRAYIPSWRVENGDARADGDGKLPGNVWGAWTDRGVARLVDNSPERIPVGKVKAPNQLPVALIERIVLLASNPGDTLLDPFHGTGTGAVASLLNGRKYIGCEFDRDVANASVGWIKARLKLRAQEGK